MKNILLVAPVVVVVIAPAHAQKSEMETCGEANSTVEIVKCLQTRTAAWDRRLNAAYKKLLSESAARQQEALRVAQRLWVQYRDANCRYYALGEGTIARVEAGECVRSMTEARARELEGAQN